MSIEYTMDISQMYERRYVGSLFWKKVMSDGLVIVKGVHRTSSQSLKPFLEGIGGKVLACYQGKRTHKLLIEVDTTIMELDLDIEEGGNTYNITIAGPDNAAVETVEKAIVEVLPVVENNDPSKISMSFSYFSESGGATNRLRKIEAPAWDQIKNNYPQTVTEKLDQLVSTEQPTTSGKMILLHGLPGTGKTHAIRALVRQWAPWCKSSYIVDPESFFGSPSYMFEMVLDSEHSDGSIFEDIEDVMTHIKENQSEKKWTLFIVEDVDELISSDAKKRTGQSLSRLLNLVDGLVGQGLQIIFLMTTNEPMSKIHPALSRPGRCLANIEFTTLTIDESIEWCKQHEITHDDIKKPQTIAELYARLNNKSVIEVEQQEKRMGFRG